MVILYHITNCLKGRICEITPKLINYKFRCFEINKVINIIYQLQNITIWHMS